MEADNVPAPAPVNAMAALMAGAKAKGKERATDGENDAFNMTEEQLKALNERDGMPWVEKYRPTHLDEVVSHQDITATHSNMDLLTDGAVEKFIEAQRLPHLLLYGPPGTGKTSTVLAMARRIYGTHYRKHILELNASDDRGIDVVREQIKSFAMTKVLFSKGFKLVILDEADMMTQAAQGALRRVIETHTKNVRFAILCNYVNKITPAIQSRCTRFRFSPLPEREVERKIDEVVEKEGCNLTEDGKKALLKLSRGDMRRGLNVLQACHAGYETIDETAVYNCTGNPHPADIEAVVQSMMQEEFGTSFSRITALKTEKGLALQDMIAGAYDLLQTTELCAAARVYLLDHLGSCEHRLSLGGSEKLQLTALLGAFKVAVEIEKKHRGPQG